MITGATENSSGEYLEHYRGIPEHYRAIIWEFENSIMGQNFSIIYKYLLLSIATCLLVLIAKPFMTLHDA